MTDVPLGEPEYDEGLVNEWCERLDGGDIKNRLALLAQSQHAAYESERAAREEAERRVAELTAERDEAWRYQRQAESELHNWRDLLR